MSSPSTQPKPEEENEFCTAAQELNAIINSATQCVDRGVDAESGKRGVCHVFREQDICMCGKIDLTKYRLK